MARVQREMGRAEDRRAWFIAALCLAWPDGHTETFVGRVDGLAVWPPAEAQETALPSVEAVEEPVVEVEAP